MIVPIEETMGAMEELVQQGKIRFIGLSNFLPSEMRRAQAALSRAKIFSNQVRYSLIDRTIEGGLLDYCRQQQVAVIAFTPLGHGLEELAKMDPGDALGRVAAQAGKTRAQVALNWCLAQPGVITIPKASSVERVSENCGGSGWQLSTGQAEQLRRDVRHSSRSALEMMARRAVRYVFQRVGLERA
jgi:diketogulonate reductase-like aldo/keto reductase